MDHREGYETYAKAWSPESARVRGSQVAPLFSCLVRMTGVESHQKSRSFEILMGHCQLT